MYQSQSYVSNNLPFGNLSFLSQIPGSLISHSHMMGLGGLVSPPPSSPGSGRPSSSALSQEMLQSLRENSLSVVGYQPFKKARKPLELPGPKYVQTPDSFVLYDPVDEKKFNVLKNPTGFVPVIVHPVLVKGKAPNAFELTEVQKEGVRFGFDCFKKNDGCIFAHEMGLGKVIHIPFCYLNICKH